MYSAAWRYGTTRGCKLKGASGVSMQTCNHQQRAARMRGIACGVWFRSSSRTESRMPSREAAQLGVSGLGSHVAAKRAGAERREADFCRRATEEKQRKKTTVVRETKGGVGARACVLPAMQKCPRAPWKKAPTRERTRSIPCAKAVRCARAAVAPTHVEHVERRS